jgi:hypothetical protein
MSVMVGLKQTKVNTAQHQFKAPPSKDDRGQSERGFNAASNAVQQAGRRVGATHSHRVFGCRDIAWAISPLPCTSCHNLSLFLWLTNSPLHRLGSDRPPTIQPLTLLQSDGQLL